MKFFEKVLFRNCKTFQEFSTEDKRRYLTIFKHKHLADWISVQFVYPKSQLLITFLGLCICIANLLLLSWIESDIFCIIVAVLTLPLLILCLTLIVMANYQRLRKKKDHRTVRLWLAEKLQNVMLLDWRVISHKNWRSIKKSNKMLYTILRSDDCFGYCYDCSLRIAKLSNDSQMKILWICITDAHYIKCGHAVIEKNGFIYDTNTRRTYSKEKYFYANQVEVFKEYSINDYMSVENHTQLEKCLTQKRGLL